LESERFIGGLLNGITLKYSLSENASPTKQRSASIAVALAAAWRIRQRGGEVLNISKGDSVILDKEKLSRDLNRISRLNNYDAGLDISKAAEQVALENKYDSGPPATQN
jgi:hypothetical protein